MLLSALCECWFTVLHCWITGTEPGVSAFSFYTQFFQAYTHRLLFRLFLGFIVFVCVFLWFPFFVNRTMYHHLSWLRNFTEVQGKSFCIMVTTNVYDLDSFLAHCCIS